MCDHNGKVDKKSFFSDAVSEVEKGIGKVDIDDYRTEENKKLQESEEQKKKQPSISPALHEFLTSQKISKEGESTDKAA